MGHKAMYSGDKTVEVKAPIILWGVEASPYQLKMQALLDGAGLAWQRWPDQGTPWAARRMAWRVRRARGRRTIDRFPGMDWNLDEYPAVPYYSFDGRTFRYDSSSLALELDQRNLGKQPLLPIDPAQQFLCLLIDEAFDEFGLYMVHHKRWVDSAATNVMGTVTAAEMRHLFPLGLRQLAARQLPRRQSHRCPYLFSVAPEGFDAGVEPTRTPPAREGFPPTHALLNQAWEECLAAMEWALWHRPYLLGDHFSLADASAYGQLGMNLVDGVTAERLRELAPRTYDWLVAIQGHRLQELAPPARGGDSEGAGPHQESSDDRAGDLRPLLEWANRYFIPLMVQNEQAFEEKQEQGATLFNEAAFDRGDALYNGELNGHRYRSVVKTFQVKVWRDLRAAWQVLPEESRHYLEGLNCLDTGALNEAIP